MVKVKICGVTNETDAMWASSLGVDYIGFNFWKGTIRKISSKLAADIISKLPPYVQAVGVFVDEEIKEVIRISKKCGLKLIQLHGKEDPGYCDMLKEKSSAHGMKIVKAFKVAARDNLENVGQFASVDFFLLDAFVEGQEGGTGQVFNWDIISEVGDLGKPVFLAGGLNSLNICEAIEKVRPFAVDVATGVERLPRKKDYEKMKEFIYAAQKA